MGLLLRGVRGKEREGKGKGREGRVLSPQLGSLDLPVTWVASYRWVCVKP